MKLAFNAVFVIVFSLYSLISAGVLADNSYTVSNIPVEAEGKNATEARSAAMRLGEQRALTQLLTNLKLTAPSGSPGNVSHLVQSIEVSEEKIAANRYKAKVSVSFDQSAITRWLQISGTASANSPGQASPAPANAAPQAVISTAASGLSVEIPFQSLREWINLRTILEKEAAIIPYTLEAISISGAVVTLHSPSLDSANSRYKASGLMLTTENNHLLLRRL